MSRGNVLAILALTGLALVLAGSLHHLLQQIRVRAAARERAISLCWLAMLVAAVWAWPNGLHPTVHPFESLLLVTTVLAIPVAWIEATGQISLYERPLSVYRRVLLAAAIVLGIALVIRYAIRVEPTVESVDFYANVLYARDLASGATDVPLDRYLYFPGVYTFWRLALWLSDGSVAEVHWPYLGLLGLNAALIGAVIWRLSRNIGAAFLGGFWYVLACAQYEGLAGFTEPIGTAPMLAGLLVWAGQPLRGSRGWIRTFALSVGFGLALYAKQPGGLVAVGTLAMLLYNVLAPRGERHEVLQLLALPVLSALVFCLAILCEGDGLEPLRYGYGRLPHLVGAWTEEGNPFSINVTLIARAGGLLSIGAIVAALIWMGAALMPRLRGMFLQPWCQMVGFSVIATAATLTQFGIRPYLHYFLFGVPTEIIATVLSAVALVRVVPSALRSSPLLRLLAGGLAAVPLVAGYSSQSSPFYWYAASPNELWRLQPEVARDLESLRSILHPGQDVLVLPPRRNEVHMVTGSRSISFEHGYGWLPNKPGITARAVRSPRLEAVVVVNRLDSTDDLVWRSLECDQAVAELGPAGFQVTNELATMTVWQRRK